MWSWAGKIKPGTISEAVVGHIDLYPTLLDLLGLKKPDAQILDGVSYAKVLKSEGALDRKAFFNYHPHAGANRAGGVWARSGDWKLLRWFGNPNTHEERDAVIRLEAAHADHLPVSAVVRESDLPRT